MSETTGRAGRAAELVLTAYASLVFVALWVLVAAAAFSDGRLVADTWAWLSGLELVPAIAAWIAILPVGAFAWAWQAGLEPVWMGIVMLGLMGWTWMAWAGLARLGRRRLAT